MADQAYVVQVAGHDAEAVGYDLVAVPRGAVPIATILAVVNAVIQYGPQFWQLIQQIISAVKPQPVPPPVPPIPHGASPTATPAE